MHQQQQKLDKFAKEDVVKADELARKLYENEQAEQTASADVAARADAVSDATSALDEAIADDKEKKRMLDAMDGKEKETAAKAQKEQNKREKLANAHQDALDKLDNLKRAEDKQIDDDTQVDTQERAQKISNAEAEVKTTKDAANLENEMKVKKSEREAERRDDDERKKNARADDNDEDQAKKKNGLFRLYSYP